MDIYYFKKNVILEVDENINRKMLNLLLKKILFFKSTYSVDTIIIYSSSHINNWFLSEVSSSSLDCDVLINFI